MTSCIVFISFLGFFTGAMILLPVLGIIAQNNETKPRSIINPDFPTRSFEYKIRTIIDQIRS